MAQCAAKKAGIVKRRGRASIEWRDSAGKPQYYCYGYYDKMTDELIPHCQRCTAHISRADDDLQLRRV